MRLNPAYQFLLFQRLRMVNRLHCSQASVVSGKAKRNHLSIDMDGSQEANTMTPQLTHPGNDSIDSELDQLTYSAYLLTLDSDLALSVVMTAVDTAIGHHASHRDLLQRTIELSLTQLRFNPPSASDRESFPLETLLYSDSSFAASKRALSLKELTDGNPILLLDSGARIAFVLHNVFGYGIQAAAEMAQMTDKEFHSQLRKAYVQLASPRIGTDAIVGNVLGQIALA
jgi:hypothetical protein